MRAQQCFKVLNTKDQMKTISISTFNVNLWSVRLSSLLFLWEVSDDVRKASSETVEDKTAKIKSRKEAWWDTMHTNRKKPFPLWSGCSLPLCSPFLSYTHKLFISSWTNMHIFASLHVYSWHKFVCGASGGCRRLQQACSMSMADTDIEELVKKPSSSKMKPGGSRFMVVVHINHTQVKAEASEK